MKLRVCIIALVLLAALFLTGNFLAQQALEVYLTARTGHRVQVGQARIDLISCSLTLRNISLHEREGAAEDRLIELDRMEVDFRLKPLMKKRIQVEHLAVELAYLRLIRHADGTTNIHHIGEQLVSGKRKVGTAAAPLATGPASRPGPEPLLPSWIIDNLDLNIGEVEITDYARGTTPTQFTLTLNSHRTYQNVTSLDQVVRPFSDQFLKSLVENKF